MPEQKATCGIGWLPIQTRSSLSDHFIHTFQVSSALRDFAAQIGQGLSEWPASLFLNF